MAGDGKTPTTDRDAPDLHRCHGLMLFFVFDNVTNENYNFFILQRDFQGPLKIKWHFYCRSWWRKVFFCFIFMVVVRRPSDKLSPCSPMMRIRFWNAIKTTTQKRKMQAEMIQSWKLHRAMFPASIQFAVLLTIRFGKSKFNFPDKLLTSTLWRSPGIDSAVTSPIMRCSGLQVVSVAVHAGAPEKATKSDESCWMRIKFNFKQLFCGRILKIVFRLSEIESLAKWQFQKWQYDKMTML